MKRELKRQIKQDELRSGVEHARAWISAHRQEVRVTGLVLAILAVAGGGFGYLQTRRAREAERDLAEALQIYHAPLAAEVREGSETPRGTVFADAAEKYRQAAAAFDGIERRYGSSAVALRARYYAALCRIQLGYLPEAEKTLVEIVVLKESDSLVPALARLALAEVYERKGDVDKAVDSYRQMADNPAHPLPRDHVLMSLASVLEEARRFPEAAASYERLSEEFPASVYAAEARRRAEYLRPVVQG